MFNTCHTLYSGATAQTAYLVGVADPNSISGSPGIVDPELYTKAHNDIRAAVEKLSSPDLTQQDVSITVPVLPKIPTLT